MSTTSQIQVALPAEIIKANSSSQSCDKVVYILSLSMLLVWRRSETSHYLGEERQNFLQN